MNQEFKVFSHISIYCYSNHPGVIDLDDFTLENILEQFKSELEIFVHSKSSNDMIFEITEEPDYNESIKSRESKGRK